MKSYLLDTSILLWWWQDDKRLSVKTRKVISNADNQIYISVCSAWEIAIKFKKYPDFLLPQPIEKMFSDQQFLLLLIELAHVKALENLEHIHQDPFDRMLISQAIAEGLTIITSDKKIGQYASVRSLLV